MEWGVDHPGRDCIEADVVLRVLTREAAGNRIKSAFGDHRNRGRNAGDGVLDQRRRDGCHTSTRALRQDLFDCELRDEDEPFQICRGETAKIVGSVVREGLGNEDAGIVDNMVDRSELSDRGLCNLLSGRCLTDVSVDDCEIQ